MKTYIVCWKSGYTEKLPGRDFLHALFLAGISTRAIPYIESFDESGGN